MRKIFILLMCCSCGVKNVETVSSISETPSPDSTIVTGFDENNYESFLDLDNYKADAPDPSEIQLIGSSAVIVINPTTEQVKEMEEKYDEDFYTILDDNSFYQMEAQSRLDSIGIKTISADKKYLKLQGKNDSWVLDIRKEGAPEWNMILFKVEKAPEIISSIDVTNEKIKEFFEL